MKKWRQKLFVVLGLTFLLVSAARCCRLCIGTPYHAPVLYELWSGETVELRVYDTAPGRPWELSAAQSSGTFQLHHTPVLTIWRDTANHSAGTSLPARGYLLLDLYDPQNIRVYPIRCGIFALREYEVEIEADGEEFTLTVRG